MHNIFFHVMVLRALHIFSSENALILCTKIQPFKCFKTYSQCRYEQSDNVTLIWPRQMELHV